MSLNSVVLMGRLTKDPELRTTASNIPVCTFTIAVDKQYNKENQHPESIFIEIVAWRNTAEFVNKYFKKGNRIIVQGYLDTRKYENKEGKKVTVYEVIASNIEFVERKIDQTVQSTEQYNAVAEQKQEDFEKLEPEAEESLPY